MLVLSWKKRMGPDEAYRVVVCTCERGLLHPLHTHDYPELFWIKGAKCHHAVNGSREPLRPGELVAMRPGDVHALSTVGHNRFVLNNIEFHPDVLRIFEREFPKEFGLLYDGGPRPRCIPIHDPFQASLLIQEFAVGHPTRFRAVALFCGLLSAVLPEPGVEWKIPSGAPEWLGDALTRLIDPQIFAGGVPAFVKAAGRSHEHVSRVCQHFLGRPPVSLVQEQRMRFAEHELRLTPRSICDIALDCGFQSTAQLHRLFKSRYGMSPMRYRKAIRGAHPT